MDGLMDRSNRMNPYRDFSHRIYIYTVIFLVIFSGFYRENGNNGIVDIPHDTRLLLPTDILLIGLLVA
jgi:hypothetical protein